MYELGGCLLELLYQLLRSDETQQRSRREEAYEPLSPISPLDVEPWSKQDKARGLRRGEEPRAAPPSWRRLGRLWLDVLIVESARDAIFRSAVRVVRPVRVMRRSWRRAWRGK